MISQNNSSVGSTTKRKIPSDNHHLPTKTAKISKKSKNGSGHWTQGLKQALKNQDNIIFETEQVSVIKDKYPKAKHHYLVIAKGDISSIKSLKYKHIPLLQHMVQVGKKIQNMLELKDVDFKMGFHAVPSMTLMHMHVISTDFDSIHLKNKRHWNSFTSDFFRPVECVLKELQEKGFLSIDGLYYKQFLESSLKCHICQMNPKNIPKLKEHIQTHFQ